MHEYFLSQIQLPIKQSTNQRIDQRMNQKINLLYLQDDVVKGLKDLQISYFNIIIIIEDRKLKKEERRKIFFLLLANKSYF